MNKTNLKAPFPYFGGKSSVAERIWSAIGDVPNYIEPFAGSLAVLLARPAGWKGVETVNDFDGLLANAWRAVRINPDAVAEHADHPVNECDLHARHLWLIGQRENITARLMGDPDFYCAKSAGWWIWGACAWIGSGWCSGSGPWISINGIFIDRRTLPHIGDAGKGINRKLPHIGDARGDYIRVIFAELSARLRDVRVACGDFSRVLGPSVTTRFGTTGVFLDPPYDAGNHDPYHAISTGTSSRARDWAIVAGCDPQFRIVLAGYDGEHDGRGLELLGWRKETWKARGGYGSQGESEGRKNATREVLWFSPHCLAIDSAVI